MGTKKLKYLLSQTVSFLVLILIIMPAAFGDETPRREEIQKPAVSLREEEILEYEGKRLSPIDATLRQNSIAGPQHIDSEDYELRIDGLVETPYSFSYEDVLLFDSYKKVVTLRCITGWTAKILWEGVLVRDIIDEFDIEDKATTVIFHAHDGYTTSFPIEFFYEKDILMAYKMNDVVIPQKRGFPFQLVAENKYGYKWIKWIERIELSDDSEYQGYWESRGFDNDADIPHGAD